MAVRDLGCRVRMAGVAGNVGVGCKRCRLFAAHRATVGLATDELATHVRDVEGRATVARTVDRADGGEQVGVGGAADRLPVTFQKAGRNSSAGIRNCRPDGHPCRVGKELVDVGFGSRLPCCRDRSGRECQWPRHRCATVAGERGSQRRSDVIHRGVRPRRLNERIGNDRVPCWQGVESLTVTGNFGHLFCHMAWYNALSH